MTVARLVAILQDAGLDAHADHVLDALWLGSLGVDLTGIGRSIPEVAASPRPVGGGSSNAAIANDPIDSGTNTELGSAEAREGRASKRSEEGPSAVYGDGDVAAEDVTVPAAAIILPAARTLPERLPLIRALRPFRLAFPSHESDLDEVRTAELTAEMRASAEAGVFPVLRPRNERWYEAHVVVEDDPTIELWMAPLCEFTQLLRDAGAFRLVRSWRLRLDPSHPANIAKARLESPAGGLSTPGSLGRARQLIFFASHGRSPRWTDGAYLRLIESWSASSVVLLHLQPRSRWWQTTLGEPQALASGRQPGVSNAALDVETFWYPPQADATVVRLPAIALDPVVLETWARMVMGIGRQTETFLLDAAEIWTDSLAETPGSPIKDVQRALTTLHERSPAAYDLAIMLASAPFTLPVARLVQEVTQDGRTDFTVLADLMLSGIVVPRSPTETVSRETTYFVVREEARPLLLRSLRAADADDLMRALDARISRHLSEIAGRALHFSALIAHPHGRAKLPGWAQEFAHIASALHDLPAATPPGRTWREVLDRFDDVILGRLARLASTGAAISAQVVDERLWPYVNDPCLIEAGENGVLAFAPPVRDYLHGCLATRPSLGLSIVWVDDNPDNNEDMIPTMIDAGATVIQVLDTDQALAHPQILICDIVISDMSRYGNDRAGLDLVGAMRARKLSMPVVIFAGYTASSASRRRTAIQAGAFGATNSFPELLWLIDRAARAAVLRQDSFARQDIEAEVLAEIPHENRSIKDIPVGEFCTLEEIFQFLRTKDYLSPGQIIVGKILLFDTFNQRTWLMSTQQQLLFILDDRKTRRRDRLCQRALPLSECSTVTASGVRGHSVVKIGDGRAPEWYYSPGLFPTPGAVEAAILDLVRTADLDLAGSGSSDFRSDSTSLCATATEHARAALERIGVVCHDDIVLEIMVEAARFRPEPGFEQAISLSRIFCGALAAARTSRDPALDRERLLLAFEATLSSPAWNKKSEQIMRLFEIDNVSEAVRRLDLGFSANARAALQQAESQGADGAGISAASLVRVLLSPMPDSQGSLLYRRLSDLRSLRLEVEGRATSIGL